MIPSPARPRRDGTPHMTPAALIGRAEGRDPRCDPGETPGRRQMRSGCVRQQASPSHAPQVPLPIRRNAEMLKHSRVPHRDGRPRHMRAATREGLPAPPKRAARSLEVTAARGGSARVKVAMQMTRGKFARMGATASPRTPVRAAHAPFLFGGSCTDRPRRRPLAAISGWRRHPSFRAASARLAHRRATCGRACGRRSWGRFHFGNLRVRAAGDSVFAGAVVADTPQTSHW